jgi:hypothetical protein
MNAVGPIRFVSGPAALDGYAQAIVGATMTLMTTYLQAESAEERASIVATVAGNLHELAGRPELAEEFRRLCGRLEAVWESMETADQA